MIVQSARVHLAWLVRDMLRLEPTSRLTVGAFVALVLAVAVTACTNDEASLQAVSADPADEDNLFEGTPEEYSLLLRACLKESGIQTEDLTDSNDQSGFSVSNVDHTPEQVAEVSERCRAEIGEPQTSGLSEAQLRQRYDARVDQWQCLTGHGLVAGEPITFETFVDDYRRSGEQTLWEPTAESALVDANGRPVSPSDLCPRNEAW